MRGPSWSWICLTAHLKNCLASRSWSNLSIKRFFLPKQDHPDIIETLQEQVYTHVTSTELLDDPLVELQLLSPFIASQQFQQVGEVLFNPILFEELPIVPLDLFQIDRCLQLCNFILLHRYDIWKYPQDIQIQNVLSPHFRSHWQKINKYVRKSNFFFVGILLNKIQRWASYFFIFHFLVVSVSDADSVRWMTSIEVPTIKRNNVNGTNTDKAISRGTDWKIG